jgi:hypothetical protein
MGDASPPSETRRGINGPDTSKEEMMANEVDLTFQLMHRLVRGRIDMSKRGNFKDRLVGPALPHSSDTRNYITMKTSWSRNLLLFQEQIALQIISTTHTLSQYNRSPVERKPEPEDPRAPSLSYGRIGIVDRREILILQSKTCQ